MACRWSRPTCSSSRIPATWRTARRSRPPISCGAFSAWPTARASSPLLTRNAGFGIAERQRWEGDLDWQPTREAIEKLLLAYDWDQAFVGLNLVVKPVVDALFLKGFADLAREHGDELDALLAEDLYLDAQRSRRWTVEACGRWSKADAANLSVLRERLAQWQPLGHRVIESASRLLARHALATKASVIADRASTEWSAFLADTGVGLGS